MDKYLDDATLSGLESVSIVHGKGTGALRRALHEYFQAHPRVGAVATGSVPAPVSGRGARRVLCGQ